MLFPEVLVLGATGRIGRVLQHVWEADGRAGSVLWHGRRSIASSMLNHVEFDMLRDVGALTTAARNRAAILCLAGVIPGRGDNMKDNVALAEAAIRAGAKAGARVFLVSSAAVYGAQTGILLELSQLRPQTDYGRAKMEMEMRGLALGAELGVPVCILRVGNIAGLDAILGGWQPGFKLDVFDDGRSPRRSYIGVQELARVIAEVLITPDLPKIMNIAAPGTVEMGALLDAANLRWTPRQALDSAIPEVCLNTKVLEQIVRSKLANPTRLVEEWRMLQPYLGNEMG